MRVTNLFFAQKHSNNGLKEIDIMTSGSRFVLLAGSNGSGKTRFLKVIKGSQNKTLFTEEKEETTEKIEDIKRIFIKLKNNSIHLENYLTSCKLHPDFKKNYNEIKTEIENKLGKNNKFSKGLYETVANIDYFLTCYNDSDQKNAQDIVADHLRRLEIFSKTKLNKQYYASYESYESYASYVINTNKNNKSLFNPIYFRVNLNDPLKDGEEKDPNLIKNFFNLRPDLIYLKENGDVDKLYNANYTYAYLNYYADRALKTMHQEHNGAVYEKEQNRWKDLKNLVHNVIELNLDVTENGKAALDGRLLNDGGFSDGQNALLQLAVTIHANTDELDGSVLLLDEIESFIHPKALFKALDNLTQHVDQIWLSTHSVALLSYYANRMDSTLIWMHDGEATNVLYHSEVYDKMIESLLGHKDNAMLMTDFLDGQQAFYCRQYALECLGEATTVGYKEGDSQLQLITSKIKELKQENNPLTILDYGTGQGRLLEELFKEKEAGYDLYAMDVTCSLESSLLEKLNQGEKNNFCPLTDQKKIEAWHNKFDVIVLCNVWHEISQNEWHETVKNLHCLLKNGGYVLLIEAEKLETGEKAHQAGFLVLSRKSAEIYFGKHDYMAQKPRNTTIGLHLISKQNLDNINKEKPEQHKQRLTKTFEGIIEETKDNLKCYDKACTTLNQRAKARYYAFLTHQLTNAYRAMEGW